VTFMDRVYERGAGNPLVFPNMVMNAALAYLSIELGVTGPTVMTTEISAGSKVHAASPPDFLLLAARGLRKRGAATIFDHHDLSPELYEVKFGRRGIVAALLGFVMSLGLHSIPAQQQDCPEGSCRFVAPTAVRGVASASNWLKVTWNRVPKAVAYRVQVAPESLGGLVARDDGEELRLSAGARGRRVGSRRGVRHGVRWDRRGRP